MISYSIFYYHFYIQEEEETPVRRSAKSPPPQMAPTAAPRTAPTPAPKTAQTPAPKTAPIQSIVHPPAAASAPGAVPVDIDNQNGNGHGDLIQLDEEDKNDHKKSARTSRYRHSFKNYREAFKSSGGRPRPQPIKVAEKRSGGQSQKNKHGPKPKKQTWAKAQKTRMGQSPKNMPWPMQKIIIPKGVARSAAPLGFIVYLHWPRHFFCIGQPIFFLHWPTHIFSAFGLSIFFGGPPIHILFSAYFLAASL